MAFTNLIGFGMGIETFALFFSKIFGSLAGLLDFTTVIAVFFFNAILLFYIREHEDDPDKGF
jgi:hypothetical protein